MLTNVFVNNRYQVLQQIGQGSQGHIMSAYDTKTKRNVAIKVIDVSTKPGMIAFTNEVRIQNKAAKSKYVCEMTDCLQVLSEGLGLIVMKKYQTDLYDSCFAGSEPLPDSRIKQIFKQICRGVRDLHKNGIAHLDIKPENILIDANGNAALCDFGCSYFSKKERIISGIKGRGTVKYSAPEVINSDEYDPFKADIYSLGILLHVIATGFFPTPSNPHFAAQVADEDCFSLLQMLLAVDPASRATIDQVLSHKYFPNTNRVILSDKLPKFLRR